MVCHTCQNFKYEYLCLPPPPPIRWGSPYCFTAVIVGVTLINKEPSAPIFLGGYDLHIWAKGQALSVLCCSLFFYNFIKSMRGILIKHGRKLHFFHFFTLPFSSNDN